MTDIPLDERKLFAELHAVAQRLPKKVYRRVTGQIQKSTDWSLQWINEGDREASQHHFLTAMHYYNLARFPYADSTTARDAQQHCVQSFQQWAATKPGIERRNLQWGVDSIPFYFRCLSPTAPLLLVIGGIVSIKEQWSAFLDAGGALGVSVAVIEMPGVGENPLSYHADQAGFISALIDSLNDETDVERTFAVGMSFGGHLLLRAMQFDKRILGLTTVGAPIHHFFNETEWWPKVPLLTKMTLAHLAQVPLARLQTELSTMTLSEQDLQLIEQPVFYVQSLHDEVIPASEIDFLRCHLPNLQLHRFNDVHGSPNHMSVLRTMMPYTVLIGLRQRPMLQRLLALKLKVALNLVQWFPTQNKKDASA